MVLYLHPATPHQQQATAGASMQALESETWARSIALPLGI